MPSATPNALENMSRLQPLRLLDPSAHFDRIEATRYRRGALIWELALKKLKLRYNVWFWDFFGHCSIQPI